MPAARLILLTSAEDDAATAPLRSSLESWCRAGLLDGVAFARAADLAHRSGGAECEWASGRQWTRAPLDTVASTGLSQLWVAALRSPNGGAEEARHTEEDALSTLNRLFGTAVAVRSLTVAATGRDRTFGRSDFSAMWDLHLVHDRRVAPDARSATVDASDGDPLALCAAVALCAAGGWTGSTTRMDFVDRVDGPVKHPRVVHAQQRVLHTPDLAYLGMPGSPPWPTPVAAGVTRALPGSMPPAHVARHLARQCRFDCALAPAGDDQQDARPGLWACLFGPLSEPLPRTEGELALRRLANRTGGYESPGSDGMVRLSLDGLAGTARVAEFVGHIRQSNFRGGAHSAGAEGATPGTWQTVRGTFFGLVDGAQMPAGAPTVQSGQGRDGEVLVWPDPSALAPSRVPADDDAASPEPMSEAQSDVPQAKPGQQPQTPHQGSESKSSPKASGSRFPMKPSRSRRAEGPSSTARAPERGDRQAAIPRHDPAVAAIPPNRRPLWEIAEAIKVDGEAAPSDSRRADAADEPGSAGEDRRHGSGDSGDGVAGQRTDHDATGQYATGHAAAPDEWLTSYEDALPTGGDHDTLMSRLAGSIDGAVARAHRNFERYAAVRPMGDEHRRPRACRLRARATLAAVVLLLAAVVAAGLDQRWPYLAVAWEAVTPWEARPAYGPAIWPIGWFAAGIIVVLLGGRTFRLTAAAARSAVRDLLEGERLRREFTGNCVHYAAELLRLHSLSEQFADHRRIITEMLHRPFGDPERAAQTRLDAEALRFDAAPPPAMLVGVANASDERVEAELRKLEARRTEKGWLTSAYGAVLEAWRTRYAARVLDDRPDPDADASIPGTAVYRDRLDGSEILGAREDFARAVASDGWALREARRAGWQQSLTAGTDDNVTAIERFLTLLEAPSAVHGPVGVATDAADLFRLGPVGEALLPDQVSHRFSWTDMLDPSAAAMPPKISAIGSGAAVVASDDSGTMVLLSWRLEYSERVRAENLRGWIAAGRDDTAPTPTGGVT